MSAYYYFLNRSGSSDGFRELLNGGIFVDKSRLIEETNKRITTKEKWICVSRPRRFGKTMALEMLAAYYTKGISSEELFKNLDAEKCKTFYKHLNSHNVISINFSDYFDNNNSVKECIARMSERLIRDLDNAGKEMARQLQICWKIEHCNLLERLSQEYAFAGTEAYNNINFVPLAYKKDYVLLTKGYMGDEIKVMEYRVVEDQDALDATDHSPVFVDVKVN